MIRLFRHYIPVPYLVLGLIENVILFSAVFLGIYITHARNPLIERELVDRGVAANLPGALVFVVAILVMMFATGLYNRTYGRDMPTIALRLLASFGLAFVTLALVFYLWPDLWIWRDAVTLAVGLALAGVLAARFVFIKVCDLDAFKRRILVVGAGERAARIERLAASDAGHGFAPVGFVPSNDAAVAVSPEHRLAGVNSLSEFARARGVDEIVVAVEDRRGGLPVEALLECKLDGLRVVDFESFMERETGRVDLDSMSPSWMIYSDGFAVGPLRDAVKRGFDLTVASIMLILVLPLLLATAIAIRLESPGPVLYRQERVGHRGRRFTLLKFRSMRLDAECDGTPRWAAENDPRVTRVGAFIRKTRIDELPQLVNVLKGEMSFVGPRPERPFFVDRLAGELVYYAERHRVKPGITGWAQLNHPYGASLDDAKGKLRYDLYYVKNFSVFLDLIILMQTVRVVLWPEGVR